MTDEASVLVNLGIFVATVIAAIVAWRGVSDARADRIAASESVLRAERIAERAASAAESSAASAALASTAVDRIAGTDAPWRIERVDALWTWSIRNASNRDVDEVEIGTANPDEIDLVKGEGFHLAGPNFFGAGEMQQIRFEGGGINQPHTVRVNVQWKYVDEARTRIWPFVIHK